MRFVLISVLFGLLPAALATAQSVKPPLEAYGQLPQISSAEISPDGTMVATIVNLESGTRIIVYEVGKGVIAQASGDQVKARDIAFYDNEHVILRASETTSTFGFRGEYEFSAAFSIRLEDNAISQLPRSIEDLFPAQSGLGRIVGKGKKDNTVLMPAYIGSRGSDPSYDLIRVALKNGRGGRVQRGTADTIDWFTDGEGNAMIRERYSNARNRYMLQKLERNQWKTIYEQADAPLPPIGIYGVLPDESGLAFIATNDEKGGFDWLMKMSFDGEVSGPILAKENAEIDEVYTNNERRVLGVRYSGSEPTYEFLDEKLNQSYQNVTELLPGGTLYVDSWSSDRSQVLYRLFHAGVGDVWIIHDQNTNELTQIASNRPDIPAEALGQVIAIEYAARDGLKIPAILTLPPGADLEGKPNLPLLVIPHGGPASYDSMNFDWMAQYFANRGYLVLQPNFRGSSGYGREFKDAGRGEWGGKMQDDITDGIAALSTIQAADKNRVCIAGASYGGYAALAGATFTPNLYRCVIAIAPVSDLNMMLRNVKLENRRGHWVIDYWEGLMADGDARRAKLKAISPVNFADQVQAPVLLLHGDDDTVVAFEQSRTMERALKRADKSVELVKLKGEDHWLSVASTRMQTLVEMDRFITAHMPIIPPRPPSASSAGLQ